PMTGLLSHVALFRPEQPTLTLRYGRPVLPYGLVQAPKRSPQPSRSNPIAAIQLPATRTTMRTHAAWSAATSAAAIATRAKTATPTNPTAPGPGVAMAVSFR